MCLQAKTTSTKRAEADIRCYKIVKYDEMTDTFMTPFMEHHIGKDTIEGSSPLKAEGEKSFEYIHDQDLFSVGSGFIHTYKYLVDAESSLFCFIDKPQDHVKIMLYECTIPTGTEYVEGISAMDIGYASEKIVFVGRIM